MAGGIDWFRWHHGSVTDPKFQLVARKSGASLPDVLAVWAYLLEKASAAEFRGCFGDIDAEAVDCLFGFDDGTADCILTQMVERKLIADEYIVAWEKRQPKREREDDKSTARVQAFRQKQRHETPGNATERQETPRGEESREEEKKEEKKEREQRASRLPADWVLPTEWEAWARQERPDLDATTTAYKFRDYWAGIAGSRGRKLNWLATWRNWVREERGTVSKASPAGQPAEPAWRTEQRLRNEQFLGPAAAKRSTTQPEYIDAEPSRRLG